MFKHSVAKGVYIFPFQTLVLSPELDKLDRLSQGGHKGE